MKFAELASSCDEPYRRGMGFVRRLLRWIVGRIPKHYCGSALDRFAPVEQQDIIAYRFRSGL